MSNPSSPLTRRRFLQGSLAGAGLLAAAPLAAPLRAADAARTSTGAATPPAPWEAARYPFELPALPYPADALDAAIDTRTMEIHHAKHHGGYVKNLNAALEPHTSLHGLTLTELLAGLEDKVPAEIRTAVRNNGGGHYNHSLFWVSLSPNSGRPSGALASAIDAKFGSTDAMLDQIVAAGLGQFGSGWAWLVRNPDGSLAVTSTPNQDNPVMEDAAARPILGVDVWEHAYYLRHQNRRGDYLAAWRTIIDWDAASRLFA